MKPPIKHGLYNPIAEHDSCGVGFVATLKRDSEHDVVRLGLRVLNNLTHRGAVGANPTTGDGAGMLVCMPDEFFRSESKSLGFDLPPLGDYAIGMMFMPQSARAYDAAVAIVEKMINDEGMSVIGWRKVPTNRDAINDEVAACAPQITQIIVSRNAVAAGGDFERKLYVARRLMEKAAAVEAITTDAADFYCASLSSRTLVYKGMFLSEQLEGFYADLSAEHFRSPLALVHQRFSTNTFPAWKLAHPYRFIAHNGEINTLRGNVNYMTARHPSSPLFGDDIAKLKPFTEHRQSDTAALDNIIELLCLSGYSPAQALATLIPEAWQKDELMPAKCRDFYRYKAPMMEPWDGPAEVVFSNGLQVGAVLDRNGLRPGRYWLTDDGLVVMASEAGVLDIAEEKIIRKWRIQPGKLLLIDLERGCLVEDDEIKREMGEAHPYGAWADDLQIPLSALSATNVPNSISTTDALENQNAENLRLINDTQLACQQRGFGYTQEDIKFILKPMAQSAVEPVGSMGDDTPTAVLSSRMKPLSTYFRQEFAQVTNPPIDPIREDIVMSLKSYLGARHNLLLPFEKAQKACVVLEHPVLTPAEFAALTQTKRFNITRLQALANTKDGPEGMAAAVEELCEKSLAAVAAGADILVLSDRDVSPEKIAIPILLATAAVHHRLVAAGRRTDVGLALETGAAREVHDFAVLSGYGAEAIYPYLAYRSLLTADTSANDDEYIHNYRQAVGKGLLKVMSKMGVSTFQSYCGAQIFEAIGLAEDFVNRYFCGTVSQIGGIGIVEIGHEAHNWHQSAYADKVDDELNAGGEYAYRINDEEHLWTPLSISKLQHSVRAKRFDTYLEYAAQINEQNEKLMTLRGLLEIFQSKTPIPLDEVEPATDIVRRFSTGAMSYGSISHEAHTTLAIAMNRIGGKSNTGEGGEETERFVKLANGDSMRSSIKQVASGRFGVTAEYLANSDMMQIKIAQGAKPGEGGQLPGHKVDTAIAKVRHSVAGVGLISPPPHHDIYSIEDIAQLIYDLKSANPKGQVSVKLVSRFGVGTVAAGVAKAKSDHITIAGCDGGTGASPLSSIKHAGTSWELGLSETHQTLVLNDLRGRIALQVDGQIKTGRDVIIGALLGADEFGFATAPLVAEGCIMMRKCHLNTCPVGIATQNPRLRKKFSGKPEHVVNYFFFVAEEVRLLLAKMGKRTLNDIIGCANLLKKRQITHWKAKKIDLRPLLTLPDAPAKNARYHCQQQTHELEKAIDNHWLTKAKDAFSKNQPLEINDTIKNTDRTAGAILSNAIASRYGHDGLPSGFIRICLSGVAGQSFGAFASRGMTMLLEGEANDYLGKGLSGGVLAVFPPPTTRVDGDNIIAGNTALYGAICGECYCRGVVGERFAVRNSGADAVIEGAGDHCCEYMTGGTVVVLGAIGRNFAAGMSGGVAYVLDESGNFSGLCNTEMVSIERLGNIGGLGQHLEKSDEEIVGDMLKAHILHTGSTKAKELLADWENTLNKLIKVMPHEYRRVLSMKQKQAKAS